MNMESSLDCHEAQIACSQDEGWHRRVMARICIVDGEPRNRELLRALLESPEHTLLEVESGAQALALAAQGPLDLVLVDMEMSSLDSFDTARRLKDQAGDQFLPVVLLTATNDPATRAMGLRMGADDFLTKPIDRSELLARVTHLLALRSQEATLVQKGIDLAQLNHFKDEMTDLLVHDLRNPLSVIIANLDYMARGQNDPSSFGEALEDSRDAGRRALRLVANLLDVGRLEANRLALNCGSIRVGELLVRMVRQRKVMADSRRVAIAVRATDDRDARVDEDLVSRMIENLLDNSLRYTPPDGRIDVSAVVSEECLQFRIGNSGPAIPIEERSRFFEKYGQARTNGRRPNLGLGLYFCRLVAEAHKGHIWIEETLALPTVFAVELPLGAPS